MKKLIPLFLAAILLLCNIFAGNALAANETAPETRSVPTGVASATPPETVHHLANVARRYLKHVYVGNC